MAGRFLYPNLGCREGRLYGDGHGFCNDTRCPKAQSRPDLWNICAMSGLVMSVGAILVLSTIAYLLAADEFLVQVTPDLTERERRQSQHSAKTKPWTRQDLEHYILIDPQRAGDYGHEQREHQGGLHASPRPHTRRGHWRELRAERFRRDQQTGDAARVWVKPAWIGDMEWTAAGARYKVVPPRL
jgi:hypothetical protein